MLFLKAHPASDRERTSRPLKDRALSVFSVIVFICISAPIIFLIIRLVQAPSSVRQNDLSADAAVRIKADYLVMLVNCLLGTTAMILPGILAKRFRLVIPSVIYLVYVLFLYCSIFLGELQQFYIYIPHWDSLLHAVSGIMIGALGFSFISLFRTDGDMNARPGMISFFAFCFAVTLGCFWEIFEFILDAVSDSNMQSYRMPDSTPFIGRQALFDTMKDIILDFAGAGLISLFGYFSIKFKKGWIDKLLIVKASPENARHEEKTDTDTTETSDCRTYTPDGTAES